MDRTAIEQSITRTISAVSQIATIPAAADLYNEVGVDSVNAVDILLGLEEEFGITLDDGEFASARTVAKLADLIERSKAA